MNLTKSNFTTKGKEQSVMANERLLSWFVAFGFIGVAIVLSNTLFLVALRRVRTSSLQKRRIDLLVSLSCADEIVGSVAVPLFMAILFLSHSKMKGQQTYFLLEETFMTIDPIAGLASVFTLMSLAMESFYAAVCPLGYRSMRKRIFVCLITAPWLLSCLLSLIRLITSIKYLNPLFYTFTLTVLSSLSLTTVVACYTGVWVKLKLHKRSLRSFYGNEYKRRKAEQERNMAITLLLVTIVFVVTWLPFHALNIIVNFDESVIENLPIEVVYFAKMLQYSNSFLNVLVYSAKIPEVRTRIKKILRCGKGEQEMETRL